MLYFSLATLIPAGLLMLGAVLGGWPVWAAIATITVLCALLDRLSTGDAARRHGGEFPSGDGLSLILAVLHLPMLLLAVWAIGTGQTLNGAERIGMLVGFGLFFGQIAHPNAHELIHRPTRLQRALGAMIYATLLFGHHVSAHRLVHHRHVATDKDPNSAPRGRGFWRFAPRAWIGSFRAGWEAEHALRHRTSGTKHRIHPYFIYFLWGLMALSSSFALAGPVGVLSLLGLAGYAQLQILLADYVQHYGLRRKIGETDADGGKPEPVRAAHSWNSPQLWSSAMMLNAPRHSDHHQHPMRPYPALTLDSRMPVLPHALPVMAVIALWPPLWRRVMDPRVEALNRG